MLGKSDYRDDFTLVLQFLIPTCRIVSRDSAGLRTDGALVLDARLQVWTNLFF